MGKGFIGWGGHTISGMMLKCQKQVENILKWGKFSVDSVQSAIETIKGYADKIDAKIEQYKNSSWGQKYIKADTEAPKVYVESVAVAKGIDTIANVNTKIAILEAGESAKLCIGTAESYAGADGGDTYTYANSFADVTGADTASIHGYYHKGPNYEKAVETLVAIDWESVYDRNWVFNKHHSFYSRKKKEIGEGKEIQAHNDAYVEYDNTFEITQVTKALAWHDTIVAVAEQSATGD